MTEKVILTEKEIILAYLKGMFDQCPDFECTFSEVGKRSTTIKWDAATKTLTEIIPKPPSLFD
jgi:hypothetical protein